MKIYDCFMYFDEEVVLDLRLNILDKHVDYFVIVESIFTHKGDKRELKFNHKKFEKFKSKIIYLVHDEEPKKVDPVSNKDSEKQKDVKYIMNALYRENSQRNYISNGIKNANPEDLIMISDVDEIPNLEQVNLSIFSEKIILFRQDMFYYKFNLKIPNFKWTGTKACKFKNFLSAQWLRNVKDRRYPIFRIDTFFSKKKYTSVKIINEGGWHFSNIKTAEEIEYKLKSYLHHREFDLQPLSVDGIKKIIENKQAIYDLTLDKTVNKIGSGSKLVKTELINLPNFLQVNKKSYESWLD